MLLSNFDVGWSSNFIVIHTGSQSYQKLLSKGLPFNKINLSQKNEKLKYTFERASNSTPVTTNNFFTRMLWNIWETFYCQKPRFSIDRGVSISRIGCKNIPICWYFLYGNPKLPEDWLSQIFLESH